MSATPETTIIGRMTGIVKWFNNKSGFGFITVCSDNAHKGTDIFAHYSAIRDSKTQYKYLLQGEYVEFDLVSTETGTHKFNASEICGVMGGLIMCETRKIAFDQSARDHTQRDQPTRDQPTRDQSDRKYIVRPPRQTDHSRQSSSRPAGLTRQASC
jgi:cold shock CspA family protein